MNELKDYQKRVVEEKIALDEKITKLKAFMNSDTFKTLSAMEKDILMRQSYAMDDYSFTLKERIDLWTKE